LQKFQVGVLEGSEGIKSPQLGTFAAVQDAVGSGGGVGSVLRRMNNFATTGRISFWPLLISAAVSLVFAVGLWGVRASRSHVTSAGPNTAEVGPAYAFLAGIIVASSVGATGLNFVYRRFEETLKAEKDVFQYPSIIEVNR
jgi:hypothetical protein